jgi:hypothetical protein
MDLARDALWVPARYGLGSVAGFLHLARQKVLNKLTFPQYESGVKCAIDDGNRARPSLPIQSTYPQQGRAYNSSAMARED